MGPFSTAAQHLCGCAEIAPLDMDPGLYEQLVTRRLRERLDELIALGRHIREGRIDAAEEPEVLSRHVGLAVTKILTLVPPEHRVSAANGLLQLAGTLAPGAAEVAAEIAPGPNQLEEILPASALDGVTYLRPQIPLSRTDLLVNARGEPALAHEIAAELTSADEVDLLCAFIKWYGLRLIVEPLATLCQQGRRVRVITTTYVGATERRALDELVRLGAHVKISYETQRTRLHAKAWLFRRRSGFDTAYVGSSNLSRAALLDGLEWNVRLARAENPALIEKFAATFDAYWEHPAFEAYNPEQDGDRLDDALRHAARREPLRLSGLEVRPFAFQQEILDRLDVERQVHGRFRNLVVAATGTGKTVMAALDYRRLRIQHGDDLKLLFVAHRKEILEQSLATFGHVLNDATFGELYVGGVRPERWRHVFASVQSLTSYGVEQIPPAHFDVVIIDEFHHAESATYRRLLTHLQPAILLGLTATPERADGQDISHWFGGHIAAELRLWEALEQELLCPFHYFGLADGTDLSAVEWKRGSYDQGSLENLYTGNDRRAALVLKRLAEVLPDPSRMRALGFCVSQAHATYMARIFTDAGLPSVAVDANTPSAQRSAARQQLAAGTIRCLFSVDVFNEGLDVPNVDTVLFLRPTESITVFLQQFGRGLRHAPGKACLTVLDFIGQQHKKFRFDLRYRALTGAPRRTLERQLVEGFPFLPSGCHVELDRVAQRVVIDNIRSQLRMDRRALIADIRSYGDLPLKGYLRESGRELSDIYRNGGSWTALRTAAGFSSPPAGPAEDVLRKRLHRLASADDMERIHTWRDWLQRPRPPTVGSLPIRQQRLAAMLFFTFSPDGGHHPSVHSGLEHVWDHPAVLADGAELLSAMEDRIEHVPVPLGPAFSDVPLFVHCRYSREELLAALGRATPSRPPSNDREGVRYIEGVKADVFTFTLQKSERAYSPTTMYRDYAVSPELIHWESQSTTSIESKTGQRYLHHGELGSHVLLFARETDKDDIGTRSFLFLGPARYVSHQGSRPIAITWRLDHPLPADFFATAQVLAG
jgi:superfamily II DNA or RNA helicase/HKD family nuclease